MANTHRLIETLKTELRAKQVTYRQIAKKLDLSEASVKRMFASEQFTLDRIEVICSMVAWDWVDLVEASKAREQKKDRLTDEQENEIAADIELLLVAVSVINGYRFGDILAQYNLSEPKCIQKLAQLDRLNLIELLPGNRIKLKISPNFSWNPKGPIQRFFLKHVVHDFFDTDFDGEQEKLVVVNTLFSDNAHSEIQKKMDKLAAEASAIMQAESKLPMNEKKGNTLMLALRHWRFVGFDKLAKNQF